MGKSFQTKILLLAMMMSLASLKVVASENAPWRTEGTASTQMPSEFKNVGITEKNGDQIDPSISFNDDNGQKVTLGQFFDGKKPLLLSLVYLECPNLCNLHLNGLNEAFQKMDWTIGDKFNVLTVSFDPKETPTEAAEKKANYIAAYGRKDGAKGWHFLTGEDSQIKKLADELGFRYKWDPQSKQYVHTSAAIVITPTGKISRYLHGISFDPKTVRLSLVEASNGVIGDIVDHVVLFCFHYDPDKRTYAFYAYNLMRYGAGLCALLFFMFLFPNWRRLWKSSHKND